MSAAHAPARAPSEGAPLPRAIAALELAVLVGGLVSLAGWVLDRPGWTDWNGDGISIQPNAALAVIAASTSLLLLAASARRAALLAGAFVAAIGASVLFQYATGADLGIDDLLLFERPWGRVGVIHPGRMGPPGATSWTLIGLALVGGARPAASRSRALAPGLALGTAGISALSLIGYLYGAKKLYTIPTITVIAMQTGVFILAVSIGILASQRDRAPIRFLVAPGIVGVLSRRVAPLLVAGPVLVGLLRVAGERARLYDSAFGSAMRTIAEIALFLLLFRWAAALIEREERRRLDAEAARSASEAEVRASLAREQEARVQAETSVRMKDDFLTTLSHELRTPLNAILGWTHLLRGDLGDRAKAEAAIDVIERNGRLQATLVADMLDLSRIISGKMRLDVQRVDLAAVTAAATESMRPATDAKGIRMDVSLPPAPAPVDGDPARLHQVVWNVLANAVKFTPTGGSIRVGVDRTADGVRLVVRDDGEGIPTEFLPHLFERFRQADASTTRGHGGLGIGLALVKDLVALHGGRVSAESEGAGKGATFTVELPAPTGSPVGESVATARGRSSDEDPRIGA